MPVKNLIEIGVFKKFIEAKIAIARKPKTNGELKKDDGPPPVKKIKLAEEVKEEVKHSFLHVACDPLQ